jgi:hypothetical protein
MLAKQVDGKGRLTLDKRFANRMVIVREVDETELVITLARVIPERETWLYENRAAKQAVFAGIEEAGRKEFAAPPDLDADAALVEEMNGDEDGVQG